MGEKKQLHGYCKWETGEISYEKTFMWLQMRNLKWETKSLLIVVQNNTICANYISAKIYYTQQNSKCRLYADRDETINRIISKWSKLAQSGYNSKYDWVMKVIHWELCKKLNFEHTTKRYKYKAESVE